MSRARGVLSPEREPCIIAGIRILFKAAQAYCFNTGFSAVLGGRV